MGALSICFLTVYLLFHSNAYGASSDSPGAQLARTYCTACHLFPEPQLLTKKQWAHQVLPQMAFWLGVEPVNYEHIQDGRIIQQANVFPGGPIVSDADWFKIWDYYVESAPDRPFAAPPKPKLNMGLDLFRVRKANLHGGAPMTCLVKIDPFDKVLYVGDAFAGILGIMNPARGGLQTLRPGGAPISVSFRESAVFLTLAGRVPPSEATEGKVLYYPRDQMDMPRPLVEQLRRPVDTQVADLDNDGREDLTVCSFGNRLGHFSWFHNLGQGRHEEHVLIARPGAVQVRIHDINHDTLQDIFVMMAQSHEGVYLFENEGKGQFKMHTIVEKHPAFGFAGFELADMNGDGKTDIITANGDNGDLPLPHKNYHGLRIYLNDGKGKFSESWFYPMEGAYKALPADYDEDGDSDLAAIAYYPDFESGAPESFVFLKNNGNMKFEPYTIPESSAGRWMVMDAGDLDGDQDIDVVLGSYVVGPTTIPVPQAMRDRWKSEGAGVLILENKLR